MKLFLSILLTLTLQGCALFGPQLVYHSFSYHGVNDGWDKGPESNVKLQEYSYGDQYYMVRKKVKPGEEKLPNKTGVSGPMPVGKFLYVRWLLKDTGEMIEHRVDLKDRLPKNMFENELTFVINGKDLYVYVVTRKPKPEYGAPPVLRNWLSRQLFTYEIYPNAHNFNEEN